MPDLVDTIREEIDARLEELRPLAREASDLQEALDALNGVSASPAAGGRRMRRPVRSVRSAAAFRFASGRHPGARRGPRRRKPRLNRERRGKALGLNRNSVATRLTQLSKRGELLKAQRGYSAASPARSTGRTQASARSSVRGDFRAGLRKVVALLVPCAAGTPI